MFLNLVVQQFLDYCALIMIRPDLLDFFFLLCGQGRVKFLKFSDLTHKLCA